MPGTATLTDDLAADMVPVADELRALADEFGVRQWDVYRVVRTWSGSRPGTPTATSFTDVATAITPIPEVLEVDSMRLQLPPTGTYEDGDVKLTGISRTYTEAELTGTASTANVEVFYKLADKLGGGQADRYFTVVGKPLSRPDNAEITMHLRRAVVTA